MIRRPGFSWYRVLLKLYPKAYRQHYEDEMLVTLHEMFGSATTTTDKRKLIIRMIRDYVISLSQQRLYATSDSFNEVPAFVKRETAISASLVAPFAVIFIYNFLSLTFHHAVAFHVYSLESHTWFMYSTVLPIIALILLIKTCLSSLYLQLLQRKWRQAIHLVFRNWLFLSVGIALIAMVAIF